MTKVYCNNCKYSVYEVWNIDTCKANVTHEDIPSRHVIIRKECNEINKNNDCKDYKPSFFTSLLQKLKRNKKPKPTVNNRFEIMDI